MDNAAFSMDMTKAIRLVHAFQNTPEWDITDASILNTPIFGSPGSRSVRGAIDTLLENRISPNTANKARVKLVKLGLAECKKKLSKLEAFPDTLPQDVYWDIVQFHNFFTREFLVTPEDIKLCNKYLWLLSKVRESFLKGTPLDNGCVMHMKIVIGERSGVTDWRKPEDGDLYTYKLLCARFGLATNFLA